MSDILRLPRLRKSAKNEMALTISSFSWGDVFLVLKNVFFAFPNCGGHTEGAVGFGHFGGAKNARDPQRISLIMAILVGGILRFVRKSAFFTA